MINNYNIYIYIYIQSVSGKIYFAQEIKYLYNFQKHSKYAVAESSQIAISILFKILPFCTINLTVNIKILTKIITTLV
jgi:hypothetical protein